MSDLTDREVVLLQERQQEQGRRMEALEERVDKLADEQGRNRETLSAFAVQVATSISTSRWLMGVLGSVAVIVIGAALLIIVFGEKP